MRILKIFITSILVPTTILYKMKICLCSKICAMLCCPPCPKHIIEHVAFQPPSPTYEIQYNEDFKTYSFQPGNLFFGSRLELNKIQVNYATTKYNNKIVCMYYPCGVKGAVTILYSHGNGSDLGSGAALMIWLARQVNCNVLMYDYSGYGRSTGKPSEKRLYADIEAAYNLLRTKYACAPSDVILIGQSLGSAPTIHLATTEKVRGVVIQSGFVSALNVAFPRAEPRARCCDLFNNIGKLAKVDSPLLVVHGTDDEVIEMCHGEALYEHCPRAVEPLWICGAGHNDVELYTQFVHRLNRFIHEELDTPWDSGETFRMSKDTA